LFSAIGSVAQRPFAREYWLNEAETPVHANALLQDAEGYMWVGTDAGLYRFNGSNFVRLQDSLNAPITALGCYGNTVLVGYKNGAIAQVRNERSVDVIRRASKERKAITSISPLSSGRILVASEDELFFIDAGLIHTVKHHPALPEGYYYTLLPLSPSLALLASDEGLSKFVFANGQWHASTISGSQGLPDPILRVVKPIPNSSLCWLGTQAGGIALYNAKTGSAWVPFYAGDWSWGQVNDILPVSRDKAYAVTETGYLLEMSLSDSSHVSITPHLYPGKVLNKLLADKTGNLWCATNENLLKISLPYAGYMPLQAPYTLHQLTAIACDHDGNLWLAQDNLLYQKRAADTASRPKLIAKAPSGITSLFVDKDGRIWAGTLGSGLWYMRPDEGGLRHVGIDALKAENILSIAGTNNSLWIATLSGVLEVTYPDAAGTQSVMRHYTKESGIGTDYVYQIYPDRSGRIWMATDGAGVAMYDGKGFHKWDGSMGIRVAYAITEDAQGDIWAATLEKGLFCFHAGAWKPYGREEGLQDPTISSLSVTGSGMVVAVNKQGIDQWYPNSKLFRHYNRRLGLDIDSTSPVLNCIARDDAGNVYVPFEHGIIRLNNDAAHFDIRPDVRIAQVALFMAPLSNPAHRFTSQENNLTFFFDGLNYSNPDPVNYRYKLEGYNNSWVETADNRATFPSLLPGDYVFRLQGSLNQHFVQSGEARYSFHIGLPLWRRAWFIILCMALLSGLAWYLIRVRDKHINNLMRLKQERLAFEYEHLKTQVNPHFLFNSLNTLTGLIEDGGQESAATYTQQLSDLYRNMLIYRDRDLIFLSEECDILAAYLHIQRTRFEHSFIVKTHIPDALLKTKKIVPMSLQLLVENAIKHNVVSMTNPLVIEIHADESSITVRNALQPKLSSLKDSSSGLGLKHILRRYELLSNRKISFGPNNGSFVVNLPLL
jgi:ligand-binding sensor domain-containing protein